MCREREYANSLAGPQEIKHYLKVLLFLEKISFPYPKYILWSYKDHEVIYAQTDGRIGSIPINGRLRGSAAMQPL